MWRYGSSARHESIGVNIVKRRRLDSWPAQLVRESQSGSDEACNTIICGERQKRTICRFACPALQGCWMGLSPRAHARGSTAGLDCVFRPANSAHAHGRSIAPGLKPCLDHCVALCLGKPLDHCLPMTDVSTPGPPRSEPHPIAALTRGVAGRQRGAQPKPRAGRLGSVRHARASGHSAPRGHAAPGRRATRDPPRQHRGQVWATVGCGVVEPEMRYGFVSSGHWLS